MIIIIVQVINDKKTFLHFNLYYFYYYYKKNPFCNELFLIRFIF